MRDACTARLMYQVCCNRKFDCAMVRPLCIVVVVVVVMGTPLVRLYSVDENGKASVGEYVRNR